MTDENVLPTDEDIEQLIDRIESKRFDVTDWDVSGGMYQVPTIMVQIEFIQPPEELGIDLQENDKLVTEELIENIAEGTEYGAPIEKVKEAMENDDRIDGDPEKLLRDLRGCGEIYEPYQGYYRVT